MLERWELAAQTFYILHLCIDRCSVNTKLCESGKKNLHKVAEIACVTGSGVV